MKTYSEQEAMKINLKNKKIASETIEQNLDKINSGLKLLGVYAEINGAIDNQLDFYTNDGEYISSKMIGYLGSTIIEDYGKSLYATFIDIYENIYSFEVFKCDNRVDRYVFRKFSSKKEGTGFKIEMYFTKLFDFLEKMEISSHHKNDDYIIKEFEIGKDELRYELSNNFGAYGNYVDGESRDLWYRGNNADSDKFISMREQIWPKTEANARFIQKDLLNNIIKSNNYSTDLLTDEEMNNISLNIARHPRNKEAIEYVLNEYEKLIPGITKFIEDYFVIYSHIMDYSYVENEITDLMINDTIKEECNFENIKTAKARKLTQ